MSKDTEIPRRRCRAIRLLFMYIVASTITYMLWGSETAHVMALSFAVGALAGLWEGSVWFWNMVTKMLEPGGVFEQKVQEAMRKGPLRTSMSEVASSMNVLNFGMELGKKADSQHVTEEGDNG